MPNKVERENELDQGRHSDETEKTRRESKRISNAPGAKWKADEVHEIPHK